ncbi:MAG: hypothetical protein QM756_44105 [Polyangiaceae bacterium]
MSLSGGFDRGALRAQLTAAYFPARREDSTSVPAASAVFELRRLEIAGCWWPPLRSLRLGPCLISEFGSVLARGEGVSSPHAATKRWAASGIGAIVSVSGPKSVDFGVQASALVPWGRPDFFLGGQVVHRPASVALGLRGFLGVRF